LQNINIEQITGSIVATTSLDLGINLDAQEAVFEGAGTTAEMDPLDVLNSTNNASDIIVPNNVNHIRRGDQFSITSALGLSYTYSYGGYSIGRNVADSSPAGNGDNGQGVLTSPVSLAANPFQSVGSGSSDVIVTVPSTAGLSTGDVVSFAGSAAVGGISAAQLTGNFVITVLSATQLRITTQGNDPAVGGTAGGGAVVSLGTRPYTGAIFDATNATTRFFANTGTSGIRPESLSFSITTPTGGTRSFVYTSAGANPIDGQFNTLENLATAIDSAQGLTARLVNGRLYVGAENSNESVVFANTQVAGNAGPPTLAGVDWIGELGLSNVGTATNRFSNLQTLADNINASTGLKAVVGSPLDNSSIDITVNDPVDTISFTDRPIPAPVTLAANAYTTTIGSNIIDIAATIPGLQVGDTITLSGLAAGSYNGIPDTALNGSFTVQAIGAGTISIAVPVSAASVTAAGSFGAGTEILTALSNNGSLLGQLGIAPSLNGGPFTTPVPTAGPFGPSYDPTDATTNLAGGTIAAQYSRSITVFDDLGESHSLVVGFIKTGINEWAAEIYVNPAADVTSANNDGLLAFGNLTFDGNGNLDTIDASLTSALPVGWTTGAGASNITITWGELGTQEGMAQLAGNSTTKFATQDGATIGELTDVRIDTNGDIVTSYSNGTSLRGYRIPLAIFRGVEGLTAINNNVFMSTADSGPALLVTAGRDGGGDIIASRLESSNTDLGTQLTEMIIAQRSYQFSSRLVSTSDDLLQDLTQMGAR
jgi:flagellar hook protein FlgE